MDLSSIILNSLKFFETIGFGFNLVLGQIETAHISLLGLVEDLSHLLLNTIS